MATNKTIQNDTTAGFSAIRARRNAQTGREAMTLLLARNIGTAEFPQRKLVHKFLATKDGQRVRVPAKYRGSHESLWVRQAARQMAADERIVDIDYRSGTLDYRVSRVG